MLPEDIVHTGIAPCVKFDTVDRIVVKYVELWGCHTLGLDELKIEFDRRAQLHIGHKHAERLAVAGLGHAHCAKLFGKVGTIRPAAKLGLDAAVDFRTVG